MARFNRSGHPVGVQETKAAVEQLTSELIEPAGYHSYWSSARKKGYSGVAVYSRVEPVHVETSLGIPRFDEEGRVLQLDFPAFTLFNVYFPNGKSGSDRLAFKMAFYDAFLDRIEELRKGNKPLVFVGDVNTAHSEIDLARPKENEKVSGFLPQERAWIDTVLSRGYVDAFRMLHPDEICYSWWDLKSRARTRNVGLAYRLRLRQRGPVAVGQTGLHHDRSDGLGSLPRRNRVGTAVIPYEHGLPRSRGRLLLSVRGKPRVEKS